MAKQAKTVEIERLKIESAGLKSSMQAYREIFERRNEGETIDDFKGQLRLFESSVVSKIARNAQSRVQIAKSAMKQEII